MTGGQQQPKEKKRNCRQGRDVALRLNEFELEEASSIYLPLSAKIWGSPMRRWSCRHSCLSYIAKTSEMLSSSHNE
jgi:hypothetical protein